jgi:hypothetical protein
MRDDIDKLPIPQVGKRYSRLKGMSGLKHKQAMWYKLGDQIFNRGRKPGSGFKSVDAVGQVQHSFHKARRARAESIVNALLSSSGQV